MSTLIWSVNSYPSLSHPSTPSLHHSCLFFTPLLQPILFVSLEAIAENPNRVRGASRKVERSSVKEESSSEARKEEKLKKKQVKAKKLEAQKKLEQQLKQIDGYLATVSE